VSPSPGASCLGYWHFDLQVLPAIAFFSHASTAAASFFGFASVGAVAPEMHEAAPGDVHAWIESMAAWQSLFLPQAVSAFAQTLSMHALQSVLPNVGAGGGEASAVALDSAFSGFSAAGADDAESAAALDGAAPSDSEPLLLEELSSAGVSGGFEPPPQASQTAGSEEHNKRNETLRK
jgi:hypothetical protein